jgi:putative Mn2+ efflux pump MntP
MDLLSLLLLAIGLSMDAFAVAIGRGIAVKKDRLNAAFLLAICFGGFQMMMPAIGWFSGIHFVETISPYDHWIACLLLAFVGVKMIYEAFGDEKDRDNAPLTIAVLLFLSTATSIDALAVGLSFAFLQMPLPLPILVIGVTTFAITLLGVLLGERLGEVFGKKIEIFGGLILIGIGIRIVLEHGII